VHRPRPQDDPKQRRPDISKANDILKWEPRTALAEGLGRTISYFEKLLSDNNVRAFIRHDELAGA
jgi:UDP-glucuronate decarboxylase